MSQSLTDLRKRLDEAVSDPASDDQRAADLKRLREIESLPEFECHPDTYREYDEIVARLNAADRGLDEPWP
jgi:hypothetical protein